jgi:hypothetical protein
MKIAVIGGTGLIGSQVVTLLTVAGHQAVPHSPSTGLDLLSGCRPRRSSRWPPPTWLRRSPRSPRALR